MRRLPKCPPGLTNFARGSRIRELHFPDIGFPDHLDDEHYLLGRLKRLNESFHME
jgi:hypothetical protein